MFLEEEGAGVSKSVFEDLVLLSSLASDRLLEECSSLYLRFPSLSRSSYRLRELSEALDLESSRRSLLEWRREDLSELG